jgi:hypothetical protein
MNQLRYLLNIYLGYLLATRCETGVQFPRPGLWHEQEQGQTQGTFYGYVGYT